MENITLATCSYNTPEVTLTMLRSFFNHHDSTNVLVCENSSNEDTIKLLEENKVSYIRNKGGLHAPSVDLLIENCKTDYMLLVDTDVIFLKNHEDIFKQFKSADLTLLGEICGDRGGKRLHKRVHPWHCFINVKNVKENKIKFYDYERQIKRDGSPIYDVGASFFEDIKKANLKIAHVKLEDIYYTHYEGMSWRTLKYGSKEGNIDVDPEATHNNEGLYNYGKMVEKLYMEEIPKYKNVTIKDKSNNSSLQENKISFLISLYVDSEDRLSNLDISVRNLKENFPDCEVILSELDKESKILNRYEGVTHIFTKTEDFFNKQKAYNIAARNSKYDIISLYDADVILEKSTVNKIRDLIGNKTIQIAYPYNGYFYDVPKEYHSVIDETKSVKCVDINKCKLLSDRSVGGVVFLDKKVFWEGGGGNQNFIGAGYEDNEIYERYKKLGYNIGRMNVPLFHLTHVRKETAFDYNPYNKQNEKEFLRIIKMTKDQLLEEIKTWNYEKSIIC